MLAFGCLCGHWFYGFWFRCGLGVYSWNNHSQPQPLHSYYSTTLQPNFLELPGEALQFLFLSLWINYPDSFHITTSWSTGIAEERTPDKVLRPDIFNWGIQWNSEKYVWRHIVKELIIIWRTYWGNDIYIQCVTEKHLNISACMCFSPLFIIIFFGATQFCNILYL